uniref:Uncharacterized protein n=1 Tax=Panagrolaimus sp. PS1159 TaxID=55785 RepID=A0AC35GX15_9BILA
MKILIVLFVLFAFAMAQFPQFPDRNRCNFRCTRQASFTVMIDNQSTTATCSSGNVNDRCRGCCESWGLTNRVSKNDVTGFPSSDGRTCVCCQRQCR